MNKQNGANALYLVKINKVVIFYNVAANTESVNTELFPLREIQG